MSESVEGWFTAAYHGPDDSNTTFLDREIVPVPAVLLTIYDVWVRRAIRYGTDPGETEITCIR